MSQTRDGWLAPDLSRQIQALLPAQRWFGAKARTIAAVEVEDAWTLDTAPPCALVVSGVRYADGGAERYALLLAADAAAHVRDAASDERAARALLGGFASGGTDVHRMLRGGTLRFADADEVTRAVFDAAPAVRAVGAEQSNTTLRVGAALAFKLFRKLEEGENPELEVGRFLTTRTAFRAMPRLRGSLTYQPAHGGSTTLGVLQDWIAGLGDGWSYVIGRLQTSSNEALAGLREELFDLGTTTAAFHAALAGDDHLAAFAPEPVTRTDVEAWTASIRQRLTRVQHLVREQSGGWPVPLQQLAADVLELAARFDPVPPAAVDGRGRFDRIRVHGDYHLGQTMKTDAGWVLFDFEGEPATPLIERRRKHAALKDVAGMLRSIDYAAAAAHPGTGRAGSSTASMLREAFVSGYAASAASRDARFLPAVPSAFRAWLTFFELDKALYEVEYEVNNRPDWVWIPLNGVMALLRSFAA